MENLSGIKWGGVVETRDLGVYIENYLLLIMGGIPWQVSAVFYNLRLINQLKLSCFCLFYKPTIHRVIFNECWLSKLRNKRKLLRTLLD